MKKYCIVLSLFFLWGILLESCSKKQCYEPLYDNPPALSDTGYNTCEAIIYNFRTYSGDGVERFSPIDHKDTIRVCGYITRCTNRYAIHCQYSLVDECPLTDNHSEIELPIEWWTPDSIDIISGKKYICNRSHCF